MQPSERAGARGLSPIGNHLPMPGRSGEALGSSMPKSRTSSTDSATIGSPSPARTAVNPTGRPPSETGCGAPPTTEAEARSLLAMATPAEVDERLRAWLKPSVRSSITSITRWRESPGTGQHNDPYTAGYELRGDFEEADAREALRLAELLSAPAAPSDCATMLGKLRTITVTREVTREDLIVQIAAMTEEACAYPLDVVRDACRAWARSEKFFASWAELRQLCEERALYRRALARALRAYIEAAEQREAAAKALPPKESKACAVWHAHEGEIKAAFEVREWEAWISRSIPHRDDGETLRLAVPTRFIMDWINNNYATKLGAIIGRRVVCEVHAWAGAALDARDRRAGAKSGQ